MSSDDAEHVTRLLAEASALLGDGLVLLQIWSSPLVEWVFVGLEDGKVVVSDNGETFAEIAGVRRATRDFLPWSSERARIAADRFGIEVWDESESGAKAFRLARTVRQGETLAPIVQAIARAIDGVLALHTKPDVPSRQGYFWVQEGCDADQPT